MNLLLCLVFFISCLTQLLVALKINSFIPEYCQPLQYSKIINKVSLPANDTVLVLTAYLHEGLRLSDNFECHLLVNAPAGTGIVTTVKKISFHDNDTLVFQSGSNEEKVWLMNDDQYKYKEIISEPRDEEESNIFLKFKPNVKRSQHMAGFEIVFTSFKPKKEGQTCGADLLDCGNDRCITSDVQCDGYNNCGNETDESGCSGVSLWVIILLICIGVLVVGLAIFVWYRMAQR